MVNEEESHDYNKSHRRSDDNQSQLSLNSAVAGNICQVSDRLDLYAKYSAKSKIYDQENPPNSYGTSQTPGDGSGDEPSSDPTVAGIIGEFGWFQLLVLLFSGLRECAVGYDAVIMSIVLRPETNFTCIEPPIGVVSKSWSANFSAIADYLNASHPEQCSRQTLNGSISLDDPCKSWRFETKPGESLVADWSLVCDRHWIIALIETVFFLGLVSGNLVWGYVADKFGRRKAYLVAHSISLVSGIASVFVFNLQFFILCRFFSAFGSIGYNIIYSIQVEIIGTKYRAFSTCLNHLGWGFGVILVPIAYNYFDDYRYIISLGPMIAFAMFPWAFWLPESSRWLMANGKFCHAKRELIRAAKINGKCIDSSIEKRISLLNDKITNDKIAYEIQSKGKQQKSYMMLLTNFTYLKDTIILAYNSFLGHLFYYMLTINFAYMKNLSVEANFITSGAGEWVAVIVGALLLRFYSRKACMTLFLALMASSFMVQCLIDSQLVPAMDNSLIVTSVNAIGTLSSLLLIFVALIVNQEVYPTVIRQTGSSLVNTTGEMGSTLAPLLVEMGRRIGLWRGDIMYAAFSLMGAISMQFLTRTDDIELLDT